MERRHSIGPVARVQPKQIVINRTPKQGFNPNNRNSLGSQIGPRPPSGVNMPGGVAGNIAHKGVDDMKNKRESEKKEMNSLNERFMNFVSRARALEAENKSLREQLKKKREFDPEPMKEIYQIEIDETKRILEEANEDNAALKVHISSLEDELEDQRSLIRRCMGISFGPRSSPDMSMSMDMGIGMSSGIAGNIANKGVDYMKNKREGEKKELQGLNDRFANYVSRVRSLEAENKALREQLKMKRNDFDAEPMKEIYHPEIGETKKEAELKVKFKDQRSR